MVSDQAFGELRGIANLTRAPDQETAGREALIRFLDRWSGTGHESAVVDSLCARFGLYPYMRGTVVDPAEALAVEFHTPAPLAEEGFTLHAGQLAIYHRLMDGENVILSAPTSFGKSALLDVLVASQQWSNIVLIVPTIALIDETRRRLSRFRTTYTVVTHPGQEFGEENNIFVMTQERFLQVELPRIDFFVIDEFYKLGQFGSADSRQVLLNLVWRRLKGTGAQYYLIGPNIDALSSELDEDLAASLTKTDFRMVAVDIDDRSDIEAPFEDLVRFLQSDAAESSLVFTGSPGKADRLAMDLVDALEHSGVSSDGLASAVADWLASAYDQAWTPVISLKAGIGVHTGPMPRSVQRIMVRLFNDHLMPTLICTSTLIEGVNTAARNVVVYDRKIDGQLLDFFTFSNIRGRAGRAFQHFVGRVITYSEPPSADETEVDIPIESQSQRASLATLIQLPEAELEDDARTRLASILEQDELDLEVIRSNKGINPERQLDTVRAMREMTREELGALSWTGVPTNSQARAVLQLGFTYLLESWQRRGINFEMLWGKLQAVRNNSEDFSEIVTIQERYRRKGESRADVVTEVLRFQRNWMGFTIPSMLRAIQSIGAAVLPEYGLTPGNYEFMLREVESLYLPPGLVELDEYGIPIPLGIRLMRLGLRGADVAGLLEALPNLVANPRVMSSLSFVEQWIIEDVLEGLGHSPNLG